MPGFDRVLFGTGRTASVDCPGRQACFSPILGISSLQLDQVSLLKTMDLLHSRLQATEQFRVLLADQEVRPVWRHDPPLKLRSLEVPTDGH